MAFSDITVEEKWRGRTGTTGTNATADITYIARTKHPSKIEDDRDVKVAVLAASPSVWQDVDGTFMDRVGVSDFDEQGGGLWYVRVSYAKNSLGPLEPGNGKFTFRTSGGTQNRKYSLETVSQYGKINGAGVAGGPTKDHHNAIGVSDGSIEGTDVVVPVYEFAESYVIPNTQVSNAYKRTLFLMTGRMNDAGFKGMDKGECLFLGAEGEKQGRNGDWNINFGFAGSPNGFLQVRGIAWPSPEGIPKTGWNYLWVEYREAAPVVAGSTGLEMEPIGAYVERVYFFGKFQDIGIGTS